MYQDKRLAVGKQIHDHIVQSDMQLLCNQQPHRYVYIKWGSVVVARQVFDKLLKKDVVYWNSIIGNYAQHGHVKEAFTLFCQMQGMSLKPKQIKYMTILNACACQTALESGKEVHTHIIDAEIQSDVACGYGSPQHVCYVWERDAQLVFDEMGRPENISWIALIPGYAHSMTIVRRHLKSFVKCNEWA